MTIASPITATDLAATLRASTNSAIVTPQDPSFPAATFGVAIDDLPELVVIAATANDVAVAVRLAARAGRRVTVQVAGRRAAPGGAGTVLIVTRLLAHVVVDPAARTATVGAGSTWRQVLAAAERFGLAAVSAPAPGVGAVGSTAGGGLGPVASSFGFALDHVVAFEVVTGHGRLITVTARSEPEQFAALRAGETGSGLVTGLTVELVPVAQTFVGGLWFAEEVADTVVRRWGSWVAELPTSVSTSIGRLALPDVAEVPEPMRGRSVVHLRFAHLGDPKVGARLLAPMRAAAPALLDGVRVPLASWSVIDAEPACVGC